MIIVEREIIAIQEFLLSLMKDMNTSEEDERFVFKLARAQDALVKIEQNYGCESTVKEFRQY